MGRHFPVKVILSFAVLWFCASTALANTMYVNTRNGDSLTVYGKPILSEEWILGFLPDAAPVQVNAIDASGWAEIQYEDTLGNLVDAYVQSRYLSNSAGGYAQRTETMYVSTQDGDPLNVREKPVISRDTVIGCIPNRAAVQVISIGADGWAKILYHNDDGKSIEAYASSRYLSYSQEGYYPSAKSKSPEPTQEPLSAKQDTHQEEVTAELRSAKTVDPTFQVLVRPSRSTGRVNLRWAPHNKARAILSYPANKVLTVLMETDNWYQVRDPEQGTEGYISKKLVMVMPENH